MKSCLFILMEVSLFGLCGCTNWELTRDVYDWGSDHHQMTRKSAVSYDTNEDVVTLCLIYKHKNEYFMPCNHGYMINDKNGNSIIDMGKDDRVSYLRCKTDDINNILQLANIFNPKLSHKQIAKQNPMSVIWEMYDADIITSKIIEGQGGLVLWRFYQGRRFDDGSFYKYAYQIFDKMDVSKDNHLKINFHSYPKVYPSILDFSFANTYTSWLTQPNYLKILKSPLYILTVPVDILTGPLQTVTWRIP